MQKSRSLKQHSADLREAFRQLEQSIVANKSRVDSEILTKLDYEVKCLCDRIDANDFEGGQITPGEPLM